MNRLQVVKKYIAVAVLAVMLAVPMLLPRTVAWADAAAPTKAQLHMDYLGLVGNSGAEGPKTEAQEKPGFETKDLETTKMFWVGVRVSDLTAAGFLKDGGAHDLEIAIEYDPEYVLPCDSFSSPHKKEADISATDWMEIVKKYNFAEGDSKYTWNSNYYSMATGSAPTARPIESEGRENEIVSGWRTQYVLITKTADVSNAATNRFYNVADNEDYYIIRLPFVLKNAPAADVTAKPDVMRMALGPVSFVMTSGVGGTADDTQTYAWEATTRTDDTHNLKTYFDYYGDLNIFTAADGDTLTSLTVEYKTTDEDDKEVTETAQFYKDKEQTSKISFDTGVKEYYIEVPFDTDKLTVNMAQLTAAPVVERYDFGADTDTATIDKVTPTENASVKGKWSAEVALSGTGEDDYKDTVRIGVNSESESPTVYLIHVKRVNDEPAGEAKIILYPGNSPYGLIERMAEEYHGADGAWDAEKIAEAKKEFDKNNRFVEGYVPDGGDTSVVYTQIAWGDTDIGMVELPLGSDISKWNADNEGQYGFVNHDKDSSMLVAFIGMAFKDPGFTILDKYGKEVENLVADGEDGDTVVRTVYYKKMSSMGMSDYYTAEQTQTSSNVVGNNDDGFVVADDLFESVFAKPGICRIEYSYNGGEAVASRTLLILPQVGDVNFNTIPNNNDANQIKQNAHIMGSLPESDFDDRLIEYRVADVSMNGIANNNDANAIKQNLLKEFYVNSSELY